MWRVLWEQQASREGRCWGERGGLGANENTAAECASLRISKWHWGEGGADKVLTWSARKRNPDASTHKTLGRQGSRPVIPALRAGERGSQAK